MWTDHFASLLLNVARVAGRPLPPSVSKDALSGASRALLAPVVEKRVKPEYLRAFSSAAVALEAFLNEWDRLNPENEAGE